jgi:hypothetical protein
MPPSLVFDVNERSSGQQRALAIAASASFWANEMQERSMTARNILIAFSGWVRKNL